MPVKSCASIWTSFLILFFSELLITEHWRQWRATVRMGVPGAVGVSVL